MHVKRSRRIKSEKNAKCRKEILKVRCTLRLNIAFGEIKYFLRCFLGNIYFLNTFFVDFAFLNLSSYTGIFCLNFVTVYIRERNLSIIKSTAMVWVEYLRVNRFCNALVNRLYLNGFRLYYHKNQSSKTTKKALSPHSTLIYSIIIIRYIVHSLGSLAHVLQFAKYFNKAYIYNS